MSNPYELRYQIFESAKGLELDKFYIENENYRTTMENLTQSGIVPTPEEVPAPTFPTLESMLKTASTINTFVSSQD